MKPGNEEFDGFWYRCEVRHYSVADEWGDHSHTTSALSWIKFGVVAETPKGVWLRMVPWAATNPNAWRCAKGKPGDDFFVRGTSMRQTATPTKALALRDAIARKKRHIEGCKARLRQAENDLHLLENPGPWVLH